MLNYDLKIVEIETGFALLNLPYELKDAFKKVFKTAKWDTYRRCWTVGVRGKTKLIEFVELIEKDVEALNQKKEEQETERLNENQIMALNSELNKLRDHIDLMNEELTSFKQTNSVLSDLKEQLFVVQDKHTRLMETLNKEKEEAIQTVNSIVDIEKIQQAFKDMKYYYKKVCSTDKHEYYRAINIIQEELIKLNENGLHSRTLKKLTEFNWNRKDKYNPFDINLENMYKLEEFDKQLTLRGE